MTIPVLHQNIEEKITIVKLKKFYSTLEQASRLNNLENDMGNFDDVLSQFNVIRKCTGYKGCADEVYKNYTNNNAHWGITDPITLRYAVLSDGSILREGFNYPNCNLYRGVGKVLSSVCTEFGIDINGLKKPNKFGKDVFFFYITKYGVIPFGTKDETSCPFSECTKNGYGCAAWVIYNENMDYTKCSNLSWDGDKKCK